MIYDSIKLHNLFISNYGPVEAVLAGPLVLLILIYVVRCVPNSIKYWLENVNFYRPNRNGSKFPLHTRPSYSGGLSGPSLFIPINIGEPVGIARGGGKENDWLGILKVAFVVKCPSAVHRIRIQRNPN